MPTTTNRQPSQTLKVSFCLFYTKSCVFIQANAVCATFSIPDPLRRAFLRRQYWPIVFVAAIVGWL
jgi:hypothetical protein